MTQVFSAGIAVLDCIFNLPSMPRAAEKHIASDVQWVVGGCAANAAIAMARLDAKVYLAAQIGDDIAGDIIVSNLEREQIDLSAVLRHANTRSSVSSIFVDAVGERQIVNFRGDPSNSGTQSPAQTFDNSAIGKLDAVLVDTRWLAGAEAALQLARQQNIPGVLDAEAPIPESLLHMATHVAFSKQGLLSVRPELPVHEALLSMHQALKAWVCVTDGAQGVLSIADNQVRHHPAYAVKALDTLGAGDVWHGAFCLQLAQQESEVAAIDFANAAAALKCSQHGGGNAAPALSEVQAFMRQQARL